ncbi:MAG: FxLYD domain-containing protein [Cyanobacteria bacterium P01_A01_bin.17]
MSKISSAMAVGGACLKNIGRSRAIARISVGLALIAVPNLIAPATQAQEDIIQIGGSPDEQQYYRSYWNDLVELGSQASQERQPQETSRVEADPESDLEKIVRNLDIRELVLEPIIRLNGSSQVFGILVNKNPEPVTVSAINFEVLDEDGNLLQTGSAQPEPSTLAPGQVVTFTKVLLTIPPDAGYEVTLSEPTFVIAPGQATSPVR